MVVPFQERIQDGGKEEPVYRNLMPGAASANGGYENLDSVANSYHGNNHQHLPSSTSVIGAPMVISAVDTALPSTPAEIFDSSVSLASVVNRHQPAVAGNAPSSVDTSQGVNPSSAADIKDQQHPQKPQSHHHKAVSDAAAVSSIISLSPHRVSCTTLIIFRSIF